MNLIHLLLNTPIPLDSPKWTDQVQAIASVVAIISPFIVDPIQEKLQGHRANLDPKRTLEKLQGLLNDSAFIPVKILHQFFPNSPVIEKLYKQLNNRKKEINNKIKQLRERYIYRKKAAQWLEDDTVRKKIALDACQSAFKNSQNRQDIERSQIYKCIDLFLNSIYLYLTRFSRRKEILSRVMARIDSLQQPVSLYINAFNYINERAKKELDSKATREIKSCLDELENLLIQKFK